MSAPHQKAGGAAFPGMYREIDGSCNFHGGISLRDYFAARAMSGICAHVDTWGYDVDGIAAKAYKLADAMLKARQA